MIRIMELRVLLVRLVILSAAMNLGLYYVVVLFVFPEWPVYKILTITSTVAPMLVALIGARSVWRPTWKLAAWWDGSTYPDLNGTWEGTVQLSTVQLNSEDGQSSVKTLPIRARIKQSMFETFIDFHGETVKSVTLAATPRIEQGQHHLYYIYRATPKNPQHQVYEGTTMLHIQVIDTPKGRRLSLSGHYYTTRLTQGRIQLIQTSEDPDRDVSFY